MALEQIKSSKRNSSNALKGTKNHGSLLSGRQKPSQKKTRQLSQSSNTKSQNLEQDMESLVDWVKENGRDNDKEVVISLWEASG